MVWVTRNACKFCVDKKNQLDVTFVFFISLLLVAQYVSGNHVPIIRSWRLRDVIASCWYVPWLQEGRQVWLVGSASMDALPAKHEAITSRSRQLLMMGTWLPETCWATSRREIKNTKVTSSWFFLSTLNYDARSTTYQIYVSFDWTCSRICHLRRGRIVFIESCYLTTPTVVKLMSGRRYMNDRTWWSIGWIIRAEENRGTWRETCSSNLMFTTNPTWSDVGLPSEGPATTCLISDVGEGNSKNPIIQLMLIGCKMWSGLNWPRMWFSCNLLWVTWPFGYYNKYLLSAAVGLLCSMEYQNELMVCLKDSNSRWYHVG